MKSRRDDEGFFAEVVVKDVQSALQELFRLDPEEDQILTEILLRWTFGHRNYDKAKRELNRYILMRRGDHPILLIGSTGTGKSKLMQDMNAMFLAEAIGKGFPVQGSGYTYLGVPTAGKLSVAGIHTQIVRHFLEPLAEYKIPYPAIRDGAPKAKAYISKEDTREAMLQVIEKVTNGEGYRALFLDDASPTAMLLKANRDLEAPLVFAEIGTRSKNCTIVISGGAELHKYKRHNDQLARRFRVVWMKPYYPNDDKDVKVYTDFLLTLETKLGESLIVPGTLSENAAEILRLCWGTIGVPIYVVASCVLRCREERQVLNWKALFPELEENYEMDKEKMELGQSFLEAAQDPKLSAEYSMFLKYVEKDERSDGGVRKVPKAAKENSGSAVSKDEGASSGSAASSAARANKGSVARHRSSPLSKPRRDPI